MAGLMKTGELEVRRGTPSADLIIINPNETTCIEHYMTTGEFHLYLDINHFIQGNTQWQKVTIKQENNCALGCVHLHNSLAKAMGTPKHVLLFRKEQNIYFKPVESDGK